MRLNKKISRLFFHLVFSIIFILLSFNTLLYIKQPGMVFYPIKEIEVTPKDWGLRYDAVDIKLSDERKITGWFLPHPEAEKTVLFFHGNGGNISHRGDSLYIFHKLKLNILIIDYPGYGGSEGEPSEKGLYQSATAAWQYLVSDKKINPENIIIFGRSLGGAVAVDLASRVKAGGVVLESTFSSVRDVVDIAFPILSDFIYLRYSFNSFHKIKKVAAPVLVVHSPDDRVIPFVTGQKLFSAVKSEKKFLQIEGGHNDGFMQSIKPYMRTLRSFIYSLQKTV